MPSEVSFTCGLCSEHYTSYDDIINHHSEKHPAYYPGLILHSFHLFLCFKDVRGFNTEYLYQQAVVCDYIDCFYLPVSHRFSPFLTVTQYVCFLCDAVTVLLIKFNHRKQD